MATILVVDDEPSIVETVSELLAWDGHEVVTASHGQRALELLQSGKRFDLLLVDFMMPLIDGVQLLREIDARGLRGDMAVVLMTAAPGSLPAALRDGADAGEPGARPWDRLLVKPFSVGALRDAISATTKAQRAG